MRGQPVHGFRLTEKRIAKGVLDQHLAAQLAEIETLQRQGKKLGPSLLKAHRRIKANARRAQQHGLLRPKIRNLHAVDKSALRREILLRKVS